MLLAVVGFKAANAPSYKNYGTIYALDGTLYILTFIIRMVIYLIMKQH